jgi:hypothetical protein
MAEYSIPRIGGTEHAKVEIEKHVEAGNFTIKGEGLSEGDTGFVLDKNDKLLGTFRKNDKISHKIPEGGGYTSFCCCRRK